MSSVLKSLSHNSVVRFYLRNKKGRFSRVKCVYMPARNQTMPGEKVKRARCRKDDKVLNGHMIYTCVDGIVIHIKRDIQIDKSMINWATFKRVK